MFTPDQASESLALGMGPEEYVRMTEDRAAQLLLTELNAPFASWEIRNGHPELLRIDEPGLRSHLAGLGHSQADVDAIAKVMTDPIFNERNRRGLERLRIRLSQCRDIFLRLSGGAHADLANIPVGVVQLPYLNAGALRTPSGGDAILINFGLCYLYDYFNFVYLNPPPASGDPGGAQKAQATRLARAIVGDKSSRAEFVTAFPRSINVDPDIALFSRIRMAISTLFVTLHEYGHIALGHTATRSKWPLPLPARQRHSYHAKLWEWEFEADQFAYDVLRGKMAPAGTPIPSRKLADMGPEDVFILMGLAHGFDRKSSPNDSHPLPKDRLFRLLGVKSDSEFLALRRSREIGAPDDGRFVDEILGPLLKATGAI